MQRSQKTCDACGYNAPLKMFEYESDARSPRPRLCRLCASTPAGGAHVYGPRAGDDSRPLFSICYVGNAMLDALGLLWPDGTPAPGTPSEIEIERDTLTMRVVDLEEENRNLDKQIDEAIRQRDTSLEKMQEAQREHEIAIRQMNERVAKAEARVAVLDVSVPEDTTEEIEDDA